MKQVVVHAVMQVRVEAARIDETLAMDEQGAREDVGRVAHEAAAFEWRGGIRLDHVAVFINDLEAAVYKIKIVSPRRAHEHCERTRNQEIVSVQPNDILSRSALQRTVEGIRLPLVWFDEPA